MSIELSLSGKTALITGGSRGIGAATVKMFVDSGAKVFFNYQKAKSAADEVIAACGKKNCAAAKQDLASAADAEKLVHACVEHFGRLDILVANHGVWPPDDQPIDQMPDAQWQRTVAINLDSVFGLVKHSVAQMKKHGGGNVVLISSTAAQRGEAFHADYAATKGALISMVKGLSTELAPDHIRVNCVAPGWVYTDMARPALDDAKLGPKINATIPLGRAAKPEEIAAPILFLCTEHAGFVTGEVFNVNGGAVLVG